MRQSLTFQFCVPPFFSYVGIVLPENHENLQQKIFYG